MKNFCTSLFMGLSIMSFLVSPLCAQDVLILASNSTPMNEYSIEPSNQNYSSNPYKFDEEEISNDEDNLDERTKMEIAAWYGLTFGDTENQNGIRRLDFKYEPNSKNLIFLFYDNALALDNNNVAALERTAPIVGIGAKHDWSSQWFSKIEVGRRFLETQDDQHLFNLENGYFFSSKLLGKVITQYDTRQDDDLFTVGGFIDFQLVKNLRLETGIFHAQNLTLDNTYNQRYLVVPKFSVGKAELIIGGYYDRYFTPFESLEQIGGGYGLLVFPVANELRANVFFNYDRGFRNEITVVSLGLNQKF